MSGYKLIYSKEAITDIKEANTWYNVQQKGLGKQFKNDVLFVLVVIKKIHSSLLLNTPISALRLAKHLLMPYIMRLMSKASWFALFQYITSAENPNRQNKKSAASTCNGSN